MYNFVNNQKSGINFTNYSDLSIAVKLKEEGRFVEALSYARLALQQDQSQAANRTLAHCLHAILKNGAYHNLNEGLAYLKELTYAKTTNSNDNEIVACHNLALDIFIKTNTSRLLANNQYQAAIDLCYACCPDNLNTVLTKNIVWCYIKWAFYLLKQNKIDYIQIKKILNNYLKLKHLEKPSKEHSIMLSIALTLARDKQLNIFKFFKLWGGKNCFMPEDYIKITLGNGNNITSLAQKTYLVIGQDMTEQNLTVEDSQILLSYFDEAIELFPKVVWFNYYKAVLFKQCKEYQKAIDCLNVLLENKNDNYETWMFLGSLYEQLGELDKAIAFYCKSLQVGSKGDCYKLNVHLALAKIFVKQKQYAKAKYECDFINKIRFDCGYSISQEDKIFLASVWYDDSEEVSNQDFYVEQAYICDNEYMYQSIPWNEAILGCCYINNKGKKRYSIYLKEQDGFEKYTTSFADLNNYAIGTRFLVKGQKDERHFFYVNSLKLQDVNIDTSIELEAIAVVDNINAQKQMVHAIADTDLDFVVRCNPFLDKLAINLYDFIKIKYIKLKDNRAGILGVEKTTTPPSEDVYKHIEHDYITEVFDNGSFVTKQGIVCHGSIYKFSTDSVMQNYIPQIEDKISGTAILKNNRKTNEQGYYYTVIKLES